MSKILFISHTRIGDCVLSTGLLRYLVERDEGARVTVAAGAVSAPIFAGWPAVERVIPIVKRPYNRHWLDLWTKVVGTGWDIVVDLRQSIIPYTVRRQRALILPANRQPRLMADHLASLTDSAALPYPKLYPSALHRQAAEKLLAEPLSQQRPILALAPSANWPPKQWPLDRFVQTALRLRAECPALADAVVAVFGAPNEAAYLQPIQEMAEQAARLHGATLNILPLWSTGDLLTTHACLERCQLFIGNDSGLMHMAAAAGIPTLGLFGPTNDRIMAPYGPSTAYVRTPTSLDQLLQSLPQVGAQNSLMTDLSVEDVVQAALALIGGGGR
jgi:ADP-heptose:LPS heptosyltransferase